MEFRSTPEQELVRAELAIELAIGPLVCYRVGYMQSPGVTPNAKAPAAKPFGTGWTQRVATVGLQVAGCSAMASKDAFPQQACRDYFNAVARTTSGGTSEIQRNIIATRRLGLARS